jgi:Rrf2 family iron-sulfur cluster assembly transcriptional regulator
MRLTTKGRYAVMAMLDLAVHSSKGVMSITQVAKRQNISVQYLERIAGKLRAYSLLKSIRGPLGGYVLAKSPKEITIAHIMYAVDEMIDTTRCQGAANCNGGLTCLGHHLWSALNKEMNKFLNGITLEMLANQPDILNIAEKQFDEYQYSIAGECNESLSTV